MVTFDGSHDLLVDRNSLLSDEDCRRERWRVLDLVKPGVRSDVRDGESLFRLGIQYQGK